MNWIEFNREVKRREAMPPLARWIVRHGREIEAIAAAIGIGFVIYVVLRVAL